MRIGCLAETKQKIYGHPPFATLIFCMMVWLAQIYPASDWRLAPRHDESRA
jgi:hypothetical protein